MAEQLINITESAAEAFKGLELPQDGPQAIRLYFQGFGWGGPSVGMALDEPNEQDKHIAQDNLTFVMAPDVVSIVDQNGGVSIDYVNDGYRKGYMVQLGTGGGDCGSCDSGGSCG